jgi:putative ABC transport system permease protein
VSTTQYLPLATTRMSLGVKIPGATPPEGDAFQIQAFDIGGDYFRTMGTPMLGGREFRWTDDERSPKVAIVNDAMAQRFWPRQNALGRVITIDTGRDAAPYEIVGVVATGKYGSLSESPTPVVFRAERQSYRPRLTLVADISGSPSAPALAAIRAEVAKLDPNLVLSAAGTLDDHLAFALFPARVSGIALSVAGALGLALALAGLAAVIAQSVAQRTREIGIRMALGARRGDILTQVVREGAILLGVGAAIGTLAAFGVTRFLSGLLYGIGATDPATFVGVIALLVTTSLGACAVVARRATTVDPIRAIRAE